MSKEKLLILAGVIVVGLLIYFNVKGRTSTSETEK